MNEFSLSTPITSLGKGQSSERKSESVMVVGLKYVKLANLC